MKKLLLSLVLFIPLFLILFVEMPSQAFSVEPEGIPPHESARTTISVTPMSPHFTIIVRPDNRFFLDPKAAYNSNRGEFMVVWIERTGAGESTITGRRVNLNGHAVGEDFEIKPEITDQHNYEIDLVYVPAHDVFWVAYAQDDDWRRYLPAAAYGDGGRYLTSWRDIEGSKPYNIGGYFLMQGKDTLEGDRFYIAYNQYSQDQPAVACGYLTPCLVVYADYYP